LISIKDLRRQTNKQQTFLQHRKQTSFSPVFSADHLFLSDHITTIATTTMSTTDDQLVASTSSLAWMFAAAKVLMYRGTQITAGLGAVVLALLYFKQESMLYFPEIGGIPRRPNDNPRRYRSPAEHNIHYEDVMIPCKDGVNIHAWLMLRTPAENNPLPTLIYFHGNAGNIGLRLPNAIQMMQYLNVNVLMVEYRGYGNSDNVSPTESGLKLDGQAALRWARQHPKLDSSKLFLFGRSLGGAVCFATADYAQKQQQQKGGNEGPPPIAGVIVENTFTSIPAMVDSIMPIVAPFKSLVLRMKWDSLLIVPTLQNPVLYLAGANDQLVPHTQMLQLYHSTKSSSINQMHVVPDGTHNETWMQGGQAYWDAIKAFLTAAVQARGTTIKTASATTGTSASASSATTDIPAAASSSSSSSIPIMPKKLFGMVKEAIHRTNHDDSSNNGGKKEL
jgi:abhydrolase domain-containing protein 13